MSALFESLCLRAADFGLVTCDGEVNDMGANLGPIGYALLFLGVAMELGLLFWLLHSISAPASTGAELRASQVDGNCVIVALAEATASPQLVEAACRLASDRQAHILLIDVLEIPWPQRLDVPLPQAEERARQILRAGADIIKGHDLEVESRVVRHRTTAEAVLELVRETGAKAVLMQPPLPYAGPLLASNVG